MNWVLITTQLDALVGILRHWVKRDENEKVMQFLMGLSDSYSTVRGNILMMSPFPDTRRVHAILMQHERQVEVATYREGQYSINWEKSNRKSENRPNRSTGSSYRSTVSSEIG
ncbi:Retrovirus-related Pol poly from transposon [Abeliophyllum distichum]|uniref:Retrovirus-related Pol poly from transposon n=1 Tax=Abeliophyllum distichum TaxID=126358 RepID=A0ABD1QA71_9LAMI